MSDTLTLEVLSWLFFVVFASLWYQPKSPAYRWSNWIFGIITVLSALSGLSPLLQLVKDAFTNHLVNSTA